MDTKPLVSHKGDASAGTDHIPAKVAMVVPSSLISDPSSREQDSGTFWVSLPVYYR